MFGLKHDFFNNKMRESYEILEMLNLDMFVFPLFYLQSASTMTKSVSI
jgi:hypothetical protein